MIKSISIGILVLVGLAQAKDFPVSDQDQANIAAICEIASMSPLVENRAQVVGIVKFCIEWKSRAAQAAAPPSPEKDKSGP